MIVREALDAGARGWMAAAPERLVASFPGAEVRRVDGDVVGVAAGMERPKREHRNDEPCEGSAEKLLNHCHHLASFSTA
jgi:hypothetical protein